jgi:pyruvate,water dikinase
MFQISDTVSDKGGSAVKLESSIPLDLYIIDLGGGLVGVPENARAITADNIASVPLMALLRGLAHPALQEHGPRPIQFNGFFSVMREQMLSPPRLVERFGDRSYAIISDKYINFSSRVGYHYSVLDSYCGQTINKNYITFSFKGGAADDVRRNRRARAIALILKGLDFSVGVMADRVDAHFQKHECPLIEERLDTIGRLLQFTRQMDMLMNNEISVEAVAKCFMEGNYKITPDLRCETNAVH